MWDPPSGGPGAFFTKDVLVLPPACSGGVCVCNAASTTIAYACATSSLQFQDSTQGGVGVSLSRPGFLFLLILQWGPVQGASSDAVSFETNLTSIDDAAADLAGSVVENGDDFALPNDAWLDNWPLSQVMPSPSMVPAVSIHRSDGGNANVSGWQMATSSSESRSSVAMPGSLVALIFGAFGLLFVTRRGVFR